MVNVEIWKLCRKISLKKRLRWMISGPLIKQQKKSIFWVTMCTQNLVKVNWPGAFPDLVLSRIKHEQCS